MTTRSHDPITWTKVDQDTFLATHPAGEFMLRRGFKQWTIYRNPQVGGNVVWDKVATVANYLTAETYVENHLLGGGSDAK